MEFLLFSMDEKEQLMRSFTKHPLLQAELSVPLQCGKQRWSKYGTLYLCVDVVGSCMPESNNKSSYIFMCAIMVDKVMGVLEIDESLLFSIDEKEPLIRS